MYIFLLWREMQQKKHSNERKPKILLWTIGVSFVVHGVFIAYLSYFQPLSSHKTSKKDDYVKITFKDQKQETKKIAEVPQPQPESDEKKILETPQVKTEPPKEAQHWGQQDHQAKKETRIDPKIPRPKAADPGQMREARKPQQEQKRQTEPQLQAEQPKQKPQPRGQTQQLKDILQQQSYENLLAFTQNELQESEVQRGFSDYLDDSIENGEAIDINTQEYRYIGYFTGMRKAIELVWNYPSDAARRGIGGNVKLKFIIQEDGKVSEISVLESSGHKALDRAIVEAIQLASPFAPLPKGFSKDRLVIKGNFVYTLHY